MSAQKLPVKFLLIVCLLAVTPLKNLYEVVRDIGIRDVADGPYLDLMTMMVTTTMIIGLVKKNDLAKKVLTVWMWLGSFSAFVLAILFLIPYPDQNYMDKFLFAMICILVSIFYAMILKYLKTDEFKEYYQKTT